MFEHRSISAFRVKTTLEKVGEFSMSERVHVLARKSNFVSSFFVVSENWQEQMEKEKQVTLLAELMRSEETGNFDIKVFQTLPSKTVSETKSQIRTKIRDCVLA